MIKIRKPNFKDAEGIARVHVNTWRTAYEDILNTEYLSKLSIKQSMVKWKKNIDEKLSIIYIAENEAGEIIGFISGGENRDVQNHSDYQAEIYAIYVLEDWSKKGIGTRLFMKIVGDFVELNLNSVIVWMLKGNNAKEFYKKMSGICLAEKPYKIGSIEKTLIAFGFKNIRNLFD